MKKFFMGIVSFCISATLFVFQAEDGIRYSESFPMGNARFTAMSGAFGALGGNISGVSVNPAGSAIFKQSTMELTPSFLHTKTQNYYLGSYNASFTSSLAIPNIGVALAYETSENDLMVSGITFTFAVNRQKYFNELANFNAFNTKHSLTDDFLRNANANNMGAAYGDLAWNTYLFDYDSVVDMFESDFRWYDGGYEYVLYGHQQDIGYKKSGTIKEYMFNLGVDFSEYVFLGTSLNVDAVKYSETFDIRESDINDINLLDSYTYSSNLDVNGSGINGKIGIIVKPHEFFRLGFAAHSPTMYALKEEYTASIKADYDIAIDGTNTSLKRTYDSYFDYSIRKPGKIVGSLGFVYKNIAMVGLDYESVNYMYSQISANSENFAHENNEIREQLSRVNNIKAGAEVRYAAFSFRGGFALYENPYTNIDFENRFYKQDFSAGIGISNNNFYCDFSWVKSKQFSQKSLYHDFRGNPVTAKSHKYSDNIFVTFGLKF
ncbi:MAG TPA: hypothetical protein PLU45_05115 [Bacteroidales bacterium]|nr:hypothetical protein [Bacteroidales bacterium]